MIELSGKLTVIDRVVWVGSEVAGIGVGCMGNLVISGHTGGNEWRLQEGIWSIWGNAVGTGWMWCWKLYNGWWRLNVDEDGEESIEGLYDWIFL